MLLLYGFLVATAYITSTDSDEHKTRLLCSFSKRNTLNCRLVASTFGSNPFSCCCRTLYLHHECVNSQLNYDKCWDEKNMLYCRALTAVKRAKSMESKGVCVARCGTVHSCFADV